MNKICIPKENVSDNLAKVVQLYFRDKDKVNVGDIIMGIETSKADIDVESEFSGFIYYEVTEGNNISFNQVVAIIFDSIEQLCLYNENKAMKVESLKSNMAKAFNKVLTNSARELIDKFSININEFSEDLITKAVVEKWLAHNESFNSLEFNEDDLVIIGTGGAALMVIDAISKVGRYRIAGFIDDFSRESYFEGEAIFGGISVIDNLMSKGLKNLVLAYGFIGNLESRFNLFNKYKGKVNFPNVIDPGAIIEKSATLGIGNIILSNSYIGSKTNIGDINIINTGALISHECIIEVGNHFTPSSTIAGQVKIGSLNTFGMNCSVLMKTSIEDKVIVSNNVATTSNIKSGSIVK